MCSAVPPPRTPNRDAILVKNTELQMPARHGMDDLVNTPPLPMTAELPTPALSSWGPQAHRRQAGRKVIMMDRWGSAGPGGMGPLATPSLGLPGRPQSRL